MELKKIVLERLFDEIRSLCEGFQVDPTDSDTFLVKEDELQTFGEDLQRTIKEYLLNEISSEEVDEFDDNDDLGDDDLLFLDDDDSDLD